MSDQPRFTALGKFVSILLVVGLIALGVYMIQRGRSGSDAPDDGNGRERHAGGR